METLGSQPATAALPAAKRRRTARPSAADSEEEVAAAAAELAAAAEVLGVSSGGEAAEDAAADEPAQSVPQPKGAPAGSKDRTLRQQRSVHWDIDVGNDGERAQRVSAHAQERCYGCRLQGCTKISPS